MTLNSERGNYVAKVRGYFVPHPPIIVEEIGRGYLEQVRNTRTAMRLVAEEISHFSADLVLISTPHNAFIPNRVGVLTKEKLSGSFADFGFPNLRYDLEGDPNFVSTLLSHPETREFVTAVNSSELDHGTLVFVDFLKRAGASGKFAVLTATVGSLDFFYRFGAGLRKVLDESEGRFTYVASGDLSHCTRVTPGRNYHEEGPVFDKKVTEAVKNCDPVPLLDLDESFLSKAEQCGLYSFLICFGLFSGVGCSGEVLSYEDPFGVGYLVGSVKEG